MGEFKHLSLKEQLPILLQLAIAATAHYRLPPGLAVTMINLSENATYRIDAGDGRRWALRIHRDGYHSRAAIASELSWLMDLRRTGVVVTPAPVAGNNGELIQQAAHPLLPRPRYVVLFDWETGTEPGIGHDLRWPFAVLGEVTARMHLQARHWQRPPWFTRLTWDFETSLGDTTPHWGRWRDGMGVDCAKEKLFGRAM